MWSYDYALVSMQAMWDQILAYSKTTKETNHIVLFQGCQIKTLNVLPNAFPAYLLLLLQGGKSKKQTTKNFLQIYRVLKIQIPLAKVEPGLKSSLRYK